MFNFAKDEIDNMTFKELLVLRRNHHKNFKVIHGKGYKKIIKANDLFVNFLRSLSFIVYEDNIHLYLFLSDDKIVQGSLGFLVRNDWQLQESNRVYQNSKLKRFLESKHCDLDFDIFIKN